MTNRLNLARRAALCGAAALALVASLPAMAQTKTVIRYSAASPPSDFLSQSMVVFKTELEKAAPEFDVQNYPASSLFRQGTEVPALQRGNLEMMPMTTFEVSQQIPEYGFFNRAYLFRDYQHMMTVLKGPIGQTYAKRVAEVMGIEILAPTYLGTRQVNLRTARDVKGPADLAGIKMRMPATPEWLVLGQTLGVTPTPMAMPEVYLALQTGSIDGQENPLTITNAAKFYEVTKQIVLTAHLVQPVFISIAKPFFDKLTPAQKDKIRAAAVASATMNAESRFADEQKVGDDLKAKGLTVSAIDLAPFRAAADKLYATSDVAKPWNQKIMADVIATK